MMQEAEQASGPLCLRRRALLSDADRVLTTPPIPAYVKISDGCDNRCSLLRHPPDPRRRTASRPYESIVERMPRGWPTAA